MFSNLSAELDPLTVACIPDVPAYMRKLRRDVGVEVKQSTDNDAIILYGSMWQIKVSFASVLSCFYHTCPVFPNKVKISLESRSCKLETFTMFTRSKEMSPDSRWSIAYSHLVRPKKRPKNKTDQKNNRIVCQMWLGILSDLPLF